MCGNGPVSRRAYGTRPVHVTNIKREQHMKYNNWFTVDKDGLRKLIEHKGKKLVVWELVQNVWDEDATVCKVNIERIPGSPYVRVLVEDDNPEGFADISHAWTMYAESKKKSDPTKAGRFNRGEKTVIALCRCAEISTTTASISFNENGTRNVNKRRAREKGSLFMGEIRMTDAEVQECFEAFHQLIPSPNCTTTLDGKILETPKLVCEFEASLPTLKSNEEGVLTRTVRKTPVRVYEPRTGEKASIYECGIPVVETGDRYHVDIRQKVPLNMDRDNVTPSYLRRIRAEVLNHTVAKLSEDDMAEKWVDNALEDDSVEDLAVEETLTKRHGENRAIYDPSDREANLNLAAQGYTVIPGRSYSKRAWGRIKTSGAALASGQIAPTPKPYSDDPNAPARPEIAEKDWTSGMREVAEICQWFAAQMGIDDNLRVCFVTPSKRSWSATWTDAGRNGLLTSVFEWNVSRLGRSHFNEWPARIESILSTMLHEFAHHRERNHLMEDFHQGCTEYGAKAMLLLFMRSDEVPHFHKVREHFSTEAA